MKTPTLCIIHEGIGRQSAIARVAMQSIQAALVSGWKVTVVANLLDKELRNDVEWIKLYVPPRVFLLKWLTAHRFTSAALDGRKFDVVHGHQPQAASMCDVFTCHFLTHAARDRHGLESWNSARSAMTRIQQLAVVPVEDAYYRRWNPNTRMLFCSKLLQEEFRRLYPMPPSYEVLENACSPVHAATPEERRSARKALLGSDWRGLVVGYLGGLSERKGYRTILNFLRTEPDLYFLIAGESSEQIKPSKLYGRAKTIGWTANLSRFFAACDVLVVPSSFDPCPLAVLDAAAHGVPVIATSGIGNLPTLLEYGAGLEWAPGTCLAPLVRRLAENQVATRNAAFAMAKALSEQKQTARLLQIYDEVLHAKERYQYVAE